MCEMIRAFSESQIPLSDHVRWKLPTSSKPSPSIQVVTEDKKLPIEILKTRKSAWHLYFRRDQRFAELVLSFCPSLKTFEYFEWSILARNWRSCHNMQEIHSFTIAKTHWKEMWWTHETTATRSELKKLMFMSLSIWLPWWIEDANRNLS